jgi:hypothetical protein
MIFSRDGHVRLLPEPVSVADTHPIGPEILIVVGPKRHPYGVQNNLKRVVGDVLIREEVPNAE